MEEKKVYIIVANSDQSDFTDYHGERADDSKNIVEIFDTYEKAKERLSCIMSDKKNTEDYYSPTWFDIVTYEIH